MGSCAKDKNSKPSFDLRIVTATGIITETGVKQRRDHGCLGHSLYIDGGKCYYMRQNDLNVIHCIDLTSRELKIFEFQYDIDQFDAVIGDFIYCGDAYSVSKRKLSNYGWGASIFRNPKYGYRLQVFNEFFVTILLPEHVRPKNACLEEQEMYNHMFASGQRDWYDKDNEEVDAHGKYRINERPNPSAGSTLQNKLVHPSLSIIDEIRVYNGDLMLQHEWTSAEHEDKNNINEFAIIHDEYLIAISHERTYYTLLNLNTGDWCKNVEWASHGFPEGARIVTLAQNSTTKQLVGVQWDGTTWYGDMGCEDRKLVTFNFENS